jgi:putative addiction module component (TIGR02574 family)
MSELEKLQADLLALPLDSRAALARALISSLEETADENVEALWADEIRRRDEDFKNGRATARPATRVVQMCVSY